MTVPVVCEGCGRRYEVAEALAGKRGRCVHCGRLVTVPGASPGNAPPPEGHDSYALDERPEAQPSTFVRARGASEAGRGDRGAPPKSPVRSKTRGVRKPISPTTRRAGLIGLGILIAFGIVASLVPGVMWAAGVLATVAGLILFFYGFATGAYIAFTEDSLHGILFLLVPPYAAYYFVSRWDDMGIRLALVVAGLILLAVGGRILEASLARSPSDAAAVTIRTKGEMARTWTAPACPGDGMRPNPSMDPLTL